MTTTKTMKMRRKKKSLKDERHNPEDQKRRRIYEKEVLGGIKNREK